MKALSLFQPSEYLSASWCEEVRAIVRAFSGAFLFGIPLLYTMEMWWLGETSRPGGLLLLLGIALIANFALVTAAGFKHGTSLFSRVEQTMDAVAVGAIAGTIVLLVMNQVNLDQAPHTILGKIVFQMLPLSIGASLAGIVFSNDGGREGDDDEGSQMPGVWQALFNDVGATAIGAMFIAATVAPTEEVPMLAARMDYVHVLALIGLTLLIFGYVIVFASGFDRSSKPDREHPFQHPATETALSYLVALVVSFGVLFVTNQVGIDQPPAFILTQTLVLGLPSMVGGAAGRIAV